jgi:branched-chain amino acid transport system permease protein
VLGAFIVLIVIAFPKGVVGTVESIWHRRPSSLKAAQLASKIETAE